MAIEEKISTLVQSQFPSFYAEEGENFIAFVKAYYEWMETSGQQQHELKKLQDYKDIDLTIDAYIEYFRRTPPPPTGMASSGHLTSGWCRAAMGVPGRKSNSSHATPLRRHIRSDAATHEMVKATKAGPRQTRKLHGSSLVWVRSYATTVPRTASTHALACGEIISICTL